MVPAPHFPRLHGAELAIHLILRSFLMYHNLDICQGVISKPAFATRTEKASCHWEPLRHAIYISIPDFRQMVQAVRYVGVTLVLAPMAEFYDR
jgi:hypothetical protein